MENKKNTPQTHSFLYNRSAQNLVIFIVVIILAIAMAARKQFLLDPYENFNTLVQVYITTTADNTHEKAHPLYSNKNYIPPALQLIPSQLLFSSWFHVISAIAYWVFTIGGVFILVKMGGFTNYQSMAMTLFTLFAGSLITRELFDIPLLGPSPYVGYTYYDVRIYTIPLSTLGLIAIFNRRFLIAGILIGLVTFFHVKFGFRFFGLIFLSLLLWKFSGSRKLDLSQDEITWRKIFAFAMSWGILFVTTYLHINSKMQFIDSLELAQSQPFTNQLAWLIKNEPDDYLVSYYFRLGRPFFGFLCMAVAIGVFCETIIRISITDKMRKFAVIWEIVTFGAVIFWGFGFLFETLLIDLLPLSIAHSITLTRFWDLIWVVVLGFWITSIPAITLVGQKILAGIGKPQSILQNVFFHFAIIFFLCSNIAIFFISKDGELIKVSERRAGKYPFHNIMNYVQICDPATSEYNKTYLQAVGSMKAKDGKGFQEAIFRLDTIYNEFKVNLKNPPFQNPDSSFLNTTNDLLNGQFAKAITATTESRNIQGKDSYWWSCHDSEPGVHNRSINISNLDYVNAVDWIKLNIPLDSGIIQAPYLVKFTMLSQHIGFWDGKIDQHMMYIVKGYYGVGLHRLRSVAGPQAIDLEPGTASGKLGPRSREYFLSLTKEDILKIRQDYPAYDYLLTENKNLKGYLVVYSNPSLTLYDISGP